MITYIWLICVKYNCAELTRNTIAYTVFADIKYLNKIIFPRIRILFIGNDKSERSSTYNILFKSY